MSGTNDSRDGLRSWLVTKILPTLIVALVGQILAGIWYASSLNSQVRMHETRIGTLEAGDQVRDVRDATANSSIIERLARIEERVIALQRAGERDAERNPR